MSYGSYCTLQSSLNPIFTLCAHTVLEPYRVPEIEPNLGSLQSSLRRLWIMFWGKSVPTAPVWNLELKEQLKYTNGQLVVLDQYPLVLDRLRALRQPPVSIPFGGMLITGSPGIGVC